MRLNISTKKKKRYFIIIPLCVATLIATLNYYIKNHIPVESIDESWGLGKIVTESVSNNKDYEWYVDQRNTGVYGDINCGPAVIEMVDRWKNKQCTLSAQYIRDKVLNNEDGTPLAIVNSVFKDSNIKFKNMKNYANPSLFKSVDEVLAECIKKEIKAGNIVIVGLDTGALTWNTKMEQRCGKYYDWNSDHWIIIKGYKIVDKKLYFEVYDPWGSGWKYKDGTLWGKDRYYLAKEVIAGGGSYISVTK